MKVDQGSPFQKLVAGKVGGKEKREGGESEKPQIAERSIHHAVQSNVDAASTITRVASIKQSEEGHKEDKKVSSKREREEVERNVQASSETKVEDVNNLADLLASRIRKEPEKAIKAQANQETDKVQELLQ